MPLDKDMMYAYRMYMKRVSMFLTHLQIKKLQAEAKRTGLSVSELIRRFIDKGLPNAS